MEIRLLGSLEVVDDLGRPIAVRGRRLTTLLIALALRCGDVVTDDRLTEILWGDESPRGVNALQQQVSTLRRVLVPDAVVRRGSGYRLFADRSAIDAFRFENLAARALEMMREGHLARASAELEEALGLWRGDALVDVADEPFAAADRTRLDEMRLATIEARIDVDLALGRHAGIVAELEQLVLEHPMREHIRAQLMLALSRSGRQTDALRSYRTARAVLGDELGLEPSPELRALETAILRQDDVTVRRGADKPHEHAVDRSTKMVV